MNVRGVSRWAGVVTIVLTGLALVAPPAGAEPAAGTGAPPAVRKVLYAPNTGGIRVANADGSANHQVSAVSPGSVSFSPDGSKIAYTAGPLWTIPVGGGTAHRLTAAGSYTYGATWSPNGRWIAYSATTDGHSDVFRVPATGGPATRIAFGARSGCDDTQPTWSPNSSTIAYVRSGDTGCANPGLVVQPVGGTARVIIRGTVIGPSFTPTGYIVYVAYSAGYYANVGWEANADGTGQKIVDGGDNCNEGDNCMVAMVGASRVHGWVQVSTFGGEDETPGTCFEGAYLQDGYSQNMAPSFCLNNKFVNPGQVDTN